MPHPPDFWLVMGTGARFTPAAPGSPAPSLGVTSGLREENTWVFGPAARPHLQHHRGNAT